jgi:hypothetical protein
MPKTKKDPENDILLTLLKNTKSKIESIDASFVFFSGITQYVSKDLGKRNIEFIKKMLLRLKSRRRS